jgi:hypothetical protein
MKYKFKDANDVIFSHIRDTRFINIIGLCNEDNTVFDTEKFHVCPSFNSDLGVIHLGDTFGGDWNLKFFDVVPEQMELLTDPTEYLGKLKEEQSDFYDQLQKSVLEVTSDVVNKPSHYQFGIYEPVKVIQDWNLSFCLGNTLKYIARAGKKDPLKKKEDLLKAKRYIELELESME